MLQAVVFDFDGVILDTEMPLFTSWSKTFERFGVPPVGLDEWTASLGLHDDDPAMLRPLERLGALLASDVDLDEVQRVRRELRDGLLEGAPVLPGVTELLDQADALGIPVGIASSSPPEWIEQHLARRDLLDRFACISCAGGGVPGKPHPEVYRRACAALGAEPAAALALEDSPNGTTAAKAAGMRCVAVPTAISRDLDLSHADVIVGTLLELSLADW